MSLKPERLHKFDLRTAVLFVMPLAVLAAIIVVFLIQDGSAETQPPLPIEELSFERYLLGRNTVDLHVRNTGQQDVTISQVIINDAVWPFNIEPDATIPGLGAATVHLDYMWSYGEAYSISLFTSNSIAFNLDIPAAFLTPAPSARTNLTFSLIGLYVGVIPVFLGMLWFPALRRLGRRAMSFLLAATVGLLLFLGIDTLFEAREAAAGLPAAFQGIGLIAIGVVSTALLLDAIARRQDGAGGSESNRRQGIASMIAVGIGLHNLGEGLAIGAAYNIGQLALGRFLVVGFIIQNITEGLGIIAPILREQPRLRKLALLGAGAGAPAVLGVWIGGYAPSPFLAVLFLAIGAGAIFEVAYEISKLLGNDPSATASPLTVYGGVVGGMLLLWVTGLLIK